MASKRSKKTMSDEAIKQRWIDGQIAWHIKHPEARIEHAEKHFQPHNNERHRRAEQRKSIKWYREEYKKGIKPIVKPLPDQPQEYYDELERICTESIELSPNGPVVAVNIPAGQWHTVRALESGTVIMEVKDGPYEPIGSEDILEW